MTSIQDQAIAVPDVFSPATLGPVRLRNRIIKSSTYEGLSHDGRVTRELVEFHRAYARGGVGMTTMGYTAVAPEGRTDRNMALWSRENLPGMRALTEAVHAEGAAASVQTGHAGPVANPKSNRMQALAPSRFFSQGSLTFARAATRDDIARIVAAHGEAARLAVEAGFDAIEVHLGHNYLASSFLSPRVNKRDDEYGGNLANRARFARDIMRAVRDAAGDRLGILVKLNMDDGVPGGLWLDEAVAVARWLEADGTVDALEMTAGSSLLNPMYLFRGDAPLREFAAVMPQPMKLGVKLIGKRKLRSYPYEDLYLLESARQVRAAVDLPMVLLGGVTSGETMATAMAAGFEFVAMGRALLREPDLPTRIAAERSTGSLCIHCNKCMITIYSGSRCVLADHRSPRTATWGTPEGYAG